MTTRRTIRIEEAAPPEVLGVPFPNIKRATGIIQQLPAYQHDCTAEGCDQDEWLDHILEVVPDGPAIDSGYVGKHRAGGDR
jgi:hypothetical protein